MPELDEISYSRETCINAVRDYYHFLTNMYLPESEIIEPPEGGWPSITKDTLQDLGKTDEVVSLLRYLPYIRASSNGIPSAAPHAAPFCCFADWQDIGRDMGAGKMDGESAKLGTEGADIFNQVPPHVVSLTAGGRDNDVFLIDTELGIAIWVACPGEIKYNTTREQIQDDPYDYADEEEAEWRGDSAAWAIPDFFALLKDQFRDLNAVPTGPRSVVDVWTHLGPDTDGMVVELQKVYREHGWPDIERFNKQNCHEAIQRVLRERYPNYLV